MAARQHSARPTDDPRTRHLLRRHGPHHRRAQHDHDELHLDPAGDRGLAAGRLHHRVLRRQRRRIGRQPEAHRDARHKPGHGPRSSARIVVRHLPAGFRDRHRSIGQRCHRGPRQVRGLDGLRPAVDDRRLCSGGPLGVGVRRLAVRAWRVGLRGRPGRRNRLRYVGPGAGSGARPPDRFQEGRHAPAQPALRAARCRPAVVRLVRVQRRFRPGRQRDGSRDLSEHAGGRLSRHDGLAHGGAGPRWQADHIRCRLGCGRRPGCDHPILRNREHAWALRSSGWRRASSARSR